MISQRGARGNCRQTQARTDPKMNSTIAAALHAPDGSTASHPKPEVCEVRVLRSNAELEEVRDLWTRWQDDLNADMDFYLLINRLRKHVVRPHVIVVLCGGRPKAMAIGRIEQGSVKIRFGYKSFGNSPVRTLSLLFGGLLGEHTPEAAGAILASLRESLRSGEAEMLTLSFLPTDSEILRQLPDKFSFLCREHFTQKHIHWKMELGGSMADLYARLSSDHRQQLRRKAKIFEKAFPGELTIRCFREPGELEQMTRDVEMLAKTTYQRGLGVGFIDNEENRTRTAFDSERGWLRMYVLYLKGRPCAYWWGTIYQNTFYSFALGFDTQYGKYSPGTYLLNKTLEDLIKQGVKNVDFGFGDARYKKQFGNQHGYEATLNVCAARPRLIALNLIISLNNGLKAGALAIARRFNAVEIIKKRWRAKLAPKNDKTKN
jgi:hypothetical protein